MASSTNTIPDITSPQPQPQKRGQSNLQYLLRPATLLLSLINMALKRLRFHPGLTLLALFGVVLAVGLVTSAGFFAQGKNQTHILEML